MKFHNMIYQLKAFCSEHKCDTCPLLDKDVDTCSLFLEIPADWDVKRIKEIISDGDIKEGK